MTSKKPATGSTRLFYSLRPLTKSFGAEAIGIDLATMDLSNNSNDNTTTGLLFANQLRKDLVQYRALLFRGQSLTGQRQVDLSKLLGTIESTFYKHPKSPHPDIFRVSNNDVEGCTQVGRSGWHVDGTFQEKHFMYQTMYFALVADGGDTYFVPLAELYRSLPQTTRDRYDRLWMVSNNKRRPVIHPLVYQHPFRPNQEPTMLFHCGEPFVSGWLLDENDENDDDEDSGESQKQDDIKTKTNVETAVEKDRLRRQPRKRRMLPARPLQEELTREIESRLDDIGGLKMKWRPGDFLISDNLGLAHYASPGTQADYEQVGLRILHRTTIVGGPETVPQKADGRRSFFY